MRRGGSLRWHASDAPFTSLSVTSSYKGDCIAGVWSCRALLPYIHGLPITYVMDHKPLQQLRTTRDLDGVMARWAWIWLELDLKEVLRAGNLPQNADALSRLPLPNCFDRSGARLDHNLPSAASIAAMAVPPKFHGQVLEGPTRGARRQRTAKLGYLPPRLRLEPGGTGGRCSALRAL